jgi:hypothetical protein
MLNGTGGRVVALYELAGISAILQSLDISIDIDRRGDIVPRGIGWP